MAGGVLPPVLIELKAMTGEFAAKMGEAKAELGELEAEGTKHMTGLQKTGKIAATGLAAGFVGAAALSVKAGIEYQSTLAGIQGSAGLTSAQVKQMGDAFTNTMGKSTFSAQEMATAMAPVAGVVKEVNHGSLTAGQSMQFMKAAMDASEATGNNLTSTTADLSNVLLSYGLTTKDAGEASNELFNISKNTGVGLDTLSSTVDKLHGRLGIAAPTLGDTGALMVDLGQHGISGSRGVMVAQTALTTLLGGSKSVSSELQTLGVNVFDSSGKFIGMHGVLEQLTPKLAGMSDAQRLAAESTLFGTSSATAMNATLLAGAGALEKAKTATEEKDAVDKAAEVQAKSLHGQLHTMAATAEDLAAKFGMILIPILQQVISVIASVVGWFAQHHTAAIALAGVIGGVLTAAIGAWVVGLVQAQVQSTIALAKVVAGWLGVGPAATAAAVETGVAEADIAATSEAAGVATEAGLGPIGIAAAAIGLAATLLATHWHQVWGAIEAVTSAAYNDVIKPVAGFIVDDAIHPIETAVRAYASLWRDQWNLVRDGMRLAYDDVIEPVAGFIVHDAIDPIKTGVKLFADLWRTQWNIVKTVIQDVWNVIQPIIHTIEDAIGGVASAVGKVTGAVGAVTGGIGKAASWLGLDTGGAVPGSVGSPVPAIVHGGEYMLSHDMLTGGAPIDPQVTAAVLANATRSASSVKALANGAQYKGLPASGITALGGSGGGGAGSGVSTLINSQPITVHVTGQAAADPNAIAAQIQQALAANNADLVRLLAAGAR